MARSDPAERGAFARDFAALPEIFRLTDRFYAANGVPDEHRATIDFAIEEVFTNMVKYHPRASGDVGIELARDGDVVRVRLIDADATPYDVTASPEVDTTLPLEQRTPGGLGLQLTRQMMDSVEYDYENRTSRVTMTKVVG